MIDLLDAPKPLTLQLREYRRVHLSLVGCGGTGSHLASGLASIAASLRARGIEIEMHFYDGDVVEEKNVGRQLFSTHDIGRNKAEVLAGRINAAFNERVVCHPEMLLSEHDLTPGSYQQLETTLCIVVGCVDNHVARRTMEAHVARSAGRLWWLDCGNDEYSGQICIGNERQPTRMKGAAGLGLITCLPAPCVVYPDLLDNKTTTKKEAKRGKRSCAELVMEGRQGLMINRMVAAHALAMLDAFFRGDLRYFALAFDATWGGASPLVIDAPTLSRVCGVAV